MSHNVPCTSNYYIINKNKNKIKYSAIVDPLAHLPFYYNLMSNMLNQRQALAKLRAELEGREGRLCRQCGRFRHLAQKCRSGEEQKKKTVMGNRFEVLKSQVMQCGVKEVRRQETVMEGVRCFRCGEKGHKKWECPQMKERKREEMAPLHEVWRKVKEH